MPAACGSIRRGEPGKTLRGKENAATATSLHTTGAEIHRTGNNIPRIFRHATRKIRGIATAARCCAMAGAYSSFSRVISSAARRHSTDTMSMAIPIDTLSGVVSSSDSTFSSS